MSRARNHLDRNATYSMCLLTCVQSQSQTCNARDSKDIGNNDDNDVPSSSSNTATFIPNIHLVVYNFTVPKAVISLQI